MDSGAELGRREPATFADLTDLTNWADEIRRWRSETVRTIDSIYPESALASEVCPPIPDVDFEESSWAEVIDSLKKAIDSRTDALGQLIQRTH